MMKGGGGHGKMKGTGWHQDALVGRWKWVVGLTRGMGCVGCVGGCGMHGMREWAHMMKGSGGNGKMKGVGWVRESRTC